MDALNKAISIVGGQRALGEAIGLGQTAVANWIKRGGLVPIEHCMPIERATNGEVTRRMLRPGDWQKHWPELAQPQAGHAPIAIETVADAHAAIKHVEAVAVAAIRQEVGQAAAEIKHVAEELLKDDEPWDGATDRRKADELWDGKSERRKLDAPIDRRVSPASVARADWLRTQTSVKGHDITGAGT